MPKKTAQPEKIVTPKSMVELRWSRTTPEERSQFASRIAKLGWKGANRARRIASAGRRPSPDRCPCGAMTRERALARNHQCTAPPKRKK